MKVVTFNHSAVSTISWTVVEDIELLYYTGVSAGVLSDDPALTYALVSSPPVDVIDSQLKILSGEAPGYAGLDPIPIEAGSTLYSASASAGIIHLWYRPRLSLDEE